MTLREEKELVRKAKKDSEAFGRLYDEHYRKIFGYVLRRTGNIETTQDIVSETFLKALKNLWKFKWQNVPFSSWLYRIASNEIVNFYRHKKPAVSLASIAEPVFEKDILEGISLAQERLKEHQDFLEIRKQIGLLPEKYQQVLALRFFESKQIKEIAEILGKREGTIKSLVHRGLKRLKGQFNATN
ncbi:MAG: RNA polymerase sigma factor [bacterium]|nr:RNA polymerase sigma factor [bacterium]